MKEFTHFTDVNGTNIAIDKTSIDYVTRADRRISIFLSSGQEVNRTFNNPATAIEIFNSLTQPQPARLSAADRAADIDEFLNRRARKPASCDDAYITAVRTTTDDAYITAVRNAIVEWAKENIYAGYSTADVDVTAVHSRLWSYILLCLPIFESIVKTVARAYDIDASRIRMAENPPRAIIDDDICMPADFLVPDSKHLSAIAIRTCAHVAYKTSVLYATFREAAVETGAHYVFATPPGVRPLLLNYQKNGHFLRVDDPQQLRDWDTSKKGE